MSFELIVTVEEIRGNCVVHKKGDKITIQGPKIDLFDTDALCIHALPSILHYAVALMRGADPVELGLSKKGDVAYLQCPDPGAPYTEGGTVIFRIEVIKEPKNL